MPLISRRLISIDIVVCFIDKELLANQLQIKANELQAGHQREEECEVVMAADQCVPSREETSCELTQK